MYVILCTNILSALHNQMHSNANQMHGYIWEKNPTYPRYVLIDTSMKDLQENGWIHQYPTCTKAGHCITCIMEPFKQQADWNNF